MRASNHPFESPVEIDYSSEYVLRKCFDKQEPQAVQETEPHKSVLLTFGTSSAFNVKNLIAVPITQKICDDAEDVSGFAQSEQTVGCIELVNKREGCFTDLDSALLQEVGKEITMAISNEELQKQRNSVKNAKSKRSLS